MEIFKAIGKNMTYAVIAKDKATKDEALRIANTHFKTKLDNLNIQSGSVDGEDLYLGKGEVWAISKKERIKMPENMILMSKETQTDYERSDDISIRLF